MEIHDFTYMPILKVYPHWWGWGGGEENEESSTKVLLTTRYLFLKSQTTYMHFIYKAFDSEAQCSIKLVANNPKETLNSDFRPYNPLFSHRAHALAVCSPRLELAHTLVLG